MEKLKHIVSPGHRKSTDATDTQHTPSTTATSSSAPGTSASVPSAKVEGEHPIYDQFTGHASGEPVKTNDHTPHFSNTANVGTSATGATTEPSLRSHSVGRPTTLSGDPSSASIKSGVIGFPQGATDSHAALGNDHPAEQGLGRNQIVGGGNALGTKTIDPQGSASHSSRDATLGAGAGGLAAHELSSRPAHSAHGASRTTEQQPYETSLGQSPGISDTGRSFPLAGGVTTDRSVGNATTNPISERQLGTHEKDVGVHDGHGREALAGAAAAATTTSALPHREKQADTLPAKAGSGGSHHPDALAASTQPGSTGTGDHPHPDALAAATAAASKAHPTSSSAQPQSAAEQHRSGLLFTTGPHLTDTANMFDPRLHVPGEFPSPTPVEEPSAASYLESKGTTSGATGGQHELRHTGNLDEPQTRSAGNPDHHYGRDAAVSGGLGAAGAGAYAAGEHHQQETAQIGGETFPTEKSPYSSSKIDPRVDNGPRGLSEQKFDPTTSGKHQVRDAALTGSMAGAPGLTSHQTTQPRGAQENMPPTASDPVSRPQDEKSQHHYGRDAALVGAGAGAATTAGLYANQRQNEPDSGPASSTVGPHKSNAANILDPRVQPDPALQKKHHAASTADDPAPSTVGPHRSDAANVLDPRVLPDPQKQKAAPKEEHHYGRDAAVAGGTGAAGYGAYEALKSHDGHPNTQPGTATSDQRHDPSAASPTTASPTTATTQRSEDPTRKTEHHYGRDAAVVGGLGAAGAGAYGANRDRDQTQQPPVSQHQHPTSQQIPTNTQGQHGFAQDVDQHHKRDAAVVGAAGAAAGAGGAYAYSQHDADRERQAAQKAHEQQLKDQQKEFEKKQKEQEKALHDKQKQAEHEHAKDEKHHNKLVAAEEKKHQKEAEHEQKQLEKETEKEDQGKKKHGLFGFLHRDKKDKDKTSAENSPRGSTDNARHSKEYAGAGAAAGVAGGAAAYEATHEDKDGRNRLHKDPPPGHPAREAVEHPQGHSAQYDQHNPGQREHIGTDVPIRDPSTVSGDSTIGSGVYGAHEPNTQHHTVIEPHTGLPMNVEKYGDGRGGTDGSSTVGGYHQVPGQQEGQKGSVTDWDAIKKANTPY